MKTNNNQKFNLQKFEVAKLKNLKVIRGGNANGPGIPEDKDPKTTTGNGGQNNNSGGVGCRD